MHKVEAGDTAELTRRGQRVAVILSAEEYDRLRPKRSAWEAIQAFREKHNLDSRESDENDLSDADIDAIFGNLRDKSPGREVEL